MDERVDLATALGSLRRRPWLALAVVVATVGVGLLVTVLTPKVYASTSTVLVGDTTESYNIAREDILASQELATTYSDLARRQPVLGAVVDELGLDMSWLELRKRVQVNLAPGNGQLIVVTARAETEQQANQIARAVTDRLIAIAPVREEEAGTTFVAEQLERLQAELAAKQSELVDVVSRQGSAPTPTMAEELQVRADTLTRQINDLRSSYTDLRGLVPRGSGPNSLRVLEPASADPAPIRPNLRTNLLAAALIGILLAFGVCYYADYREPRGRRHRERPPNVPAHAWSPEREREFFATPSFSPGSPSPGNGIRTASHQTQHQTQPED